MVGPMADCTWNCQIAFGEVLCMDHERQHLVKSLGFVDTFAFFQTKPVKDCPDLNNLTYCLSWS